MKILSELPRAYFAYLPNSHRYFRQDGIGSLNKNDVDKFDRDGFLIIPEFISPASAPQLSDALDKKAFNHPIELVRKTAKGSPRVVLGVSDPTISEDPFYQTIRTQKAIGILQSLLGPNVIEHHSKATISEHLDHGGGGFPWIHQDNAYWPKSPSTEIAVCIALTQSNNETGTLHVIPGTHSHNLRLHDSVAGLSAGKTQPAVNVVDLAFVLLELYPELREQIFNLITLTNNGLEQVLQTQYSIPPEEIAALKVVSSNDESLVRASLLSVALHQISREKTALVLNPGDAVITSSQLWHAGSSPINRLYPPRKTLIYQLEVPIKYFIQFLQATSNIKGSTERQFLLSSDMEILSVNDAQLITNQWGK